MRFFVPNYTESWCISNMAKTDIDVLVGAKGGYNVDGESGKLIRDQLKRQLDRGVEVKLSADKKGVSYFNRQGYLPRHTGWSTYARNCI